MAWNWTLRFSNREVCWDAFVIVPVSVSMAVSIELATSAIPCPAEMWRTLRRSLPVLEGADRLRTLVDFPLSC